MELSFSDFYNYLVAENQSGAPRLVTDPCQSLATKPRIWFETRNAEPLFQVFFLYCFWPISDPRYLKITLPRNVKWPLISTFHPLRDQLTICAFTRPNKEDYYVQGSRISLNKTENCILTMKKQRKKWSWRLIQWQYRIILKFLLLWSVVLGHFL